MTQNPIAYRVVNLLELSESELPMLRRTAAGKLVMPRWDEGEIEAEISAQENQEFQGVRKLRKKEMRRVEGIFYYLKIYKPQETTNKLEGVSHYLEAFNHFCELAAWEEAWQVLFIHCDTPTREELHNQLRTWGYYRLQIELYNELLGKLDNKYRDRICYTGLGNAYQALGDYRQAIKFHEKHLEIAREIGDLPGEGRAYRGLGVVYNSQGNYNLAIKYHQKSLEIAQAIGDLSSEGRALGNLGVVYNCQENYHLAVQHHQQQLQIAQELGDRAMEGRVYRGLGVAYCCQGNYDLAIKYHQKSLEIAQAIGDRAEEGAAFGNLGNAYRSQGNYDLAIKHNHKDLEIAQEIGAHADIGATLGNLGLVYYSQGNYTYAIKYYEQSLVIARERGDRPVEANGLFNLGNALARVDEKGQAITAYENACKLYQAMGLDQKVENCNNSIRDIGMKVVVEPRRFLELPSTPARRKGRKFSRKWQQLRTDIGKSFYIFFRWVSRWVRSVFRK